LQRNGSETSSAGASTTVSRLAAAGRGEDRSGDKHEQKAHASTVPTNPSREGDAFVTEL
jgi:hypothetical protein